jgi:hypothetical protein
MLFYEIKKSEVRMRKILIAVIALLMLTYLNMNNYSLAQKGLPKSVASVVYVHGDQPKSANSSFSLKVIRPLQIIGFIPPLINNMICVRGAEYDLKQISGLPDYPAAHCEINGEQNQQIYLHTNYTIGGDGGADVDDGRGVIIHIYNKYSTDGMDIEAYNPSGTYYLNNGWGIYEYGSFYFYIYYHTIIIASNAERGTHMFNQVLTVLYNPI